MAFTLDTWAKATASANALSSTIFTYATPDSLDAIKVSGYFNPIKLSLQPGDTIYTYSTSENDFYRATVQSIAPNVTVT